MTADENRENGPREMEQEIGALIGNIAKGLEIPEKEAVSALESGAIEIEMKEDSTGERFLEVRHDGRRIHLFQGAIHYPDQETPDA